MPVPPPPPKLLTAGRNTHRNLGHRDYDRTGRRGYRISDDRARTRKLLYTLESTVETASEVVCSI